MKNCFSSLGRSQRGHVILSPFFQPRYSTVLNEKFNNLLPTFSRCAAIDYYTLYSVRELLDYYVIVQCHKNAIFFCTQFHCIEFNVPRTNFTIKHLRGKKRVATETGPDQLYPRAFSLRPNRVLFVFTIFKGMIGEKMLALRLRTAAT